MTLLCAVTYDTQSRAIPPLKIFLRAAGNENDKIRVNCSLLRKGLDRFNVLKKQTRFVADHNYYFMAYKGLSVKVKNKRHIPQKNRNSMPSCHGQFHTTLPNFSAVDIHSGVRFSNYLLEPQNNRIHGPYSS